MLRLIRDLLSRPGAARTVLVMEPDAMRPPRQYDVRPTRALYAGAAGAVGLLAAGLAVGVVAPLHALAGGTTEAETRGVAEAAARRAAALEDSMSAQAEQITVLRAVIAGTDAPADGPLDPGPPDAVTPRQLRPAPPSAAVGTEPAGGPVSLPMRTLGRGDPRAAEAYLERLRLPALPPVDSAVSRPFRPAAGHVGLDLAAAEGTPVRALAEGAVVSADWTDAGGYVVAVQHPDGYLSVYKHAGRLLRRVGERVPGRDEAALSGNPGAATTGPHLHLELWRDGLAQDPAAFLVRR